MDEPKRGTKIFIGEQDIYLWMQENPQTIWPELITASEELLYTKQDEVLAFQVENRVNKKRGLFDLFVRKKDVHDTLNKALTWAEEEEEYELCQRIKNLEDYLEKILILKFVKNYPYQNTQKERKHFYNFLLNFRQESIH